jgi:iron complex outermembrane receptor protein
MKRLGLIGIFTIFSLISIAQNYDIIGEIKDKSNQQPIENVEVLIEGTKLSAITNQDGRFIIPGINSGEHKLIFQHIGYETYSKSILLKDGKDKEISIFLNPQVRNIKGVIVEDHATDINIISKLPYIQTIINESQIEGNAARDIGDFLRSNNNISGIRKGGAGIDPVVRGLKYSQLNVQVNNGQKIEGGCPNRMDPATAHIEVDDLESIDIFKGPYALKYGPSFGGVINLKTKNIKKYTVPSIHLNVMTAYESNWNGNKEQIGVTGGNQLLSFKLYGGRKDYGNYSDGNGNEVSSAFKKLNYGGQLGILPGDNHKIIFSYEKSEGKNIRFPALPMDERYDNTELMAFDYHLENLSGVISGLKFKAYNSDVKHEMDNKYRPFSDTVVAVSSIDAINRGFRFETNLKLKDNKLAVGVDYENIKKDGERLKNMIMQPNLPVKNEKLWNNALITNLGIFSEYTRSFNIFEVIGAARLDFNNGKSDEIKIMHPMLGEIYNYAADSIQSEFINFSISAGITTQLTNKSSISFAIGRGVRSPDMTERYIILLPIGYDKFDYLGNPQLKPEANNQADLTFKHNCEKSGLLQINGFYSLINDYITGKWLPPSIQKPLTKDVLGVKQFYNAGTAQLLGFEVSYATPAKFDFGAMLFASYTYATLKKINKYILNEEGAVIDEEEITNDALSEIPPFESTLSLHYRLFKGRFVPKASIRMVASQNHVSDSQYEAETPGFVVAGISFHYYFDKYVQLSAGINNLFDTYYYEHLNRNILGTTSNLSEPGRVFYVNLYIKL